jgi:hypothetical protein
VATNLESECDALGGKWYEGEDCATFECPSECEHSIAMWDSWGDGWNGCTIDVYVNGVLVLDNVTLPSGSGPGYVYFDDDTGDDICIDFTCVSWCNEPSYCLYDGGGVEVCCANGGYNPGDGDICCTGECYDTPAACCFPDGSCEDLTLAECEAGDGFWGGSGTTCATYVCPLFLGACCMPDHSCIITNSACCEYAGGVFVGGGTECGEPVSETINLLHWTSDHSPYGPGEFVTLDLSAYAGTMAKVAFRYYGDSWDWWAMVDNVHISDVLFENFNAGIPAGWTRTDDAGAGWTWELNTSVGRPNYAGGDGTCACANSDYWYSYPYDCSLITPQFAVPVGCTLQFIAAYNYLGAGEAFQVNVMIEEPGGLHPCQYLDIKPGSCPNPLNPGSRGVIPVALVGTPDFDVTQVDLATLRLARVDGVGGEVAPNFGPPGPSPTIEDVATPFYGIPCDCHELTGDGIYDLMMHFRRTSDVAQVLGFAMGQGGEFPLYVKGNLLDGSPFVAPDCVVLVGGQSKATPLEPMWGTPLP